MTKDEQIMNALELVLKAYMHENNRLWWALWDMFWGWFGTQMELDELYETGSVR